jgi:cysteinyl-tRNA synthetase
MHRALRTWIALSAPVVGVAALLTAVDPVGTLAEPSGSKRLTQAPLDALRRTTGTPAGRAQKLAAATNWGYWLSSFEVAGVEAAPHDLMVVDNGVSANRRFMRERTGDEVARMKLRPDGTQRVLLSYLSIGEAERYRAYWRPEWYDPAKRPAWLGGPNPIWDGNYAVQFWRPEWEQLILGAPESYLDIIMGQGFDGVYLDRADAFFEWEKTRPTARADMAAFIRRIADYARRKNPEFIVVMQNAEELLDDGAVLNALDGIAKEDLLYGVGGPGTPNKPQDVKHSLDQLRMARSAGRRVLVVEYLSDPAKMEQAAKFLRAENFLPYFAPRSLGCLNPPAVAGASGALPPHPCR